MKLWVRLIAGGRLALLTAITSVATAADTPPPTRFSQSLASADRTATGLDRLSSDEIAVIDALIRRDLATQSAPGAPTPRLCPVGFRTVSPVTNAATPAWPY